MIEMTPEQVTQLLDRIASGMTTVDDAVRLARLFAGIDRNFVSVPNWQRDAFTDEHYDAVCNWAIDNIR